jgi:hypothetical protein
MSATAHTKWTFLLRSMLPSRVAFPIADYHEHRQSAFCVAVSVTLPRLIEVRSSAPKSRNSARPERVRDEINAR